MNSKIFLLSSILLISACSKAAPEKTAVDDFKNICQMDPKSANGFDCDCEANMMKDKLGNERFIKFVTFLKIDKTNQEVMRQASNDSELIDITMEVSKFAPTLIKNCAK